MLRGTWHFWWSHTDPLNHLNRKHILAVCSLTTSRGKREGKRSRLNKLNLVWEHSSTATASPGLWILVINIQTNMMETKELTSSVNKVGVTLCTEGTHTCFEWYMSHEASCESLWVCLISYTFIHMSPNMLYMIPVLWKSCMSLTSTLHQLRKQHWFPLWPNVCS